MTGITTSVTTGIKTPGSLIPRFQRKIVQSRSRYTGAILRQLRAQRGVGRPIRNLTKSLTAALAIVAAQITAAHSAPPPGADPRLTPFFESLHIRKHPSIGCCGVSDCRAVESRSPTNSPSGHWEANIDPAIFGAGAPGWLVVPDSMVQDSPSTEFRPPRAIACWSKTAFIYADQSGLMCFITPATAG